MRKISEYPVSFDTRPGSGECKKKTCMMKTFLPLLFLMISLVTGQAQPLSFDRFEPEEYAQRRSGLMEKIPGGIAVIQGASVPTSYYRFFQNNDFMYLCGLEIPDAVLVIDAVSQTSTIFFTSSVRQARNYGVPEEHILETVRISGLDARMEMDELEAFLTEKAKTSQTFYTCLNPEELMRECSKEKLRYLRSGMTDNPRDGRPTREAQFAQHLKRILPETACVEDCSEQIWELRVIKSPAEIELMREAGEIGVAAHKEMMKATYVGQPEYELAALFEYANKRRGAQDLAYYTIICSDENHPYLHYHTYDRILQDGDFLVIDGGPDYHYYDIDITVSYPVNGKFTPRQKEIYEACNAVHEACMAVYRPGLAFEDLEPEVSAKLTEMGYDINQPIFKKFRTSFGHYVGMAVHDVGGSPRVLQPGMVFANEPLAVFAEENLGVRVEDTILITADGCENLTAGLPRTVAEIEAFMAER